MNTVMFNQQRQTEFLRFLPIFALSFFLIMTGSSCKTSKQFTYFHNIEKDTTIQRYVSNEFDSKIRKGDNLGISINSLNAEENQRFNFNIITGSGDDRNATIPVYKVSDSGTIKIFRLGEIYVEGMTRKELADKLQKDLAYYLKEPLVSVNYLNRKVTVLGGVTKPSVITLEDENLSVFDALAISGDVKAESRIDNVLIIREVDSVKQFKRVNLTDHSIINSPWYYLKADDIVYVSPDNSRQLREEKRRNMQVTLSLIASGASLLFLLLNRIL